jgi:hypothetical protein
MPTQTPLAIRKTISERINAETSQNQAKMRKVLSKILLSDKPCKEARPQALKYNLRKPSSNFKNIYLGEISKTLYYDIPNKQADMETLSVLDIDICIRANKQQGDATYLLGNQLRQQILMLFYLDGNGLNETPIDSINICNHSQQILINKRVSIFVKDKIHKMKLYIQNADDNYSYQLNDVCVQLMK